MPAAGVIHTNAKCSSEGSGRRSSYQTSEHVPLVDRAVPQMKGGGFWICGMTSIERVCEEMASQTGNAEVAAWE